MAASPSTAMVGRKGASTAGSAHQNQACRKTLPANRRSRCSSSYSRHSPRRIRDQSLKKMLLSEAPAPQPAGWRNQLITPLLCHCLLNHRQIAVSARHSRLPSNTCLTCSMAQPRFMTRLIQTRHSLASPSPIARARRK